LKQMQERMLKRQPLKLPRSNKKNKTNKSNWKPNRKKQIKKKQWMNWTKLRQQNIRKNIIKEPRDQNLEESHWKKLTPNLLQVKLQPNTKEKLKQKKWKPG
jgi:hypothetical protein